MANNNRVLRTNFLSLLNEDQAKITKAIRNINAGIDSDGNVSSYRSGLPPIEIIQKLRRKTMVGLVSEN